MGNRSGINSGVVFPQGLGIGSLNGDASQVQTFAVGAGASDLTVTTLNGVHTLNFPAAVKVWRKYTVPHTALQAAALTNNIELVNIPAKTMIEGVIVKHSAAFTGTFATYTVSIGIAGTLTKYTAVFDVMQAVSNTARLIQVLTTQDVESFTGATSIKISAISTVTNLSNSTAGSIDVWLLTSLLP